MPHAPQSFSPRGSTIDHTAHQSPAEELADLLAAAEREALALTNSAEEPNVYRHRSALLERLDSLLLHPEGERDLALRRRITNIRDRIDAANARIYDAIRASIRDGRGAEALRRWLPTSGNELTRLLETEGYDYLDEIIAGVLELDDPGETTVEPTADMVFYQPTPVRYLLDLFDRVALTRDDLFVDLGSGLGHVAMLATLCTPTRAIGVELEPAYVASARRAASRLGLDRVVFMERDARDAPLDAATVFYLYTPFSGTMLRNMLDLLRRQASTRQIRVCTYGPCTRTFAEEAWLAASATPRTDRVTIFESAG